MPEAIITYENPETLQVILALAELLDFEILSIDNDTSTPEDKSINPPE
jgi:hypothetical protein